MSDGACSPREVNSRLWLRYSHVSPNCWNEISYVPVFLARTTKLHLSHPAPLPGLVAVRAARVTPGSVCSAMSALPGSPVYLMGLTNLSGFSPAEVAGLDWSESHGGGAA